MAARASARDNQRRQPLDKTPLFYWNYTRKNMARESFPTSSLPLANRKLFHGHVESVVVDIWLASERKLKTYPFKLKFTDIYPLPCPHEHREVGHPRQSLLKVPTQQGQVLETRSETFACASFRCRFFCFFFPAHKGTFVPFWAPFFSGWSSPLSPNGSSCSCIC